MKNLNSSTLIFSIVVLVLGILFATSSYFEVPRPIPTKDQEQHEPRRLSEIVAQSKKVRTKSRVAKSTTHLTLAEKCSQIDDFVSELSSDELINALLSERFEFNSQCLGDLPVMTRALFSNVFKKCQREIIAKNPQQCRGLLFLYKAHVMFNDIKGKPLSEMSTQELIQGFFATGDWPTEQEKMIDELSTRMPGSPFVAKAALFPSISIAFQTGPKFYLSESVHSKLDRALELNPDDRDLISLDMLIAVETNEPNVKKDLGEYSDLNPESGIGLYYEARLKWKSKDREASIQLIEEAIRREPQNPDFLQTLEKMKTRGFDQKVFSFRLGFNLQDL